jgi:hypothetical protein
VIQMTRVNFVLNLVRVLITSQPVTSTMVSAIEAMPDDVLILLLLFLDPKDILTFRRVC